MAKLRVLIASHSQVAADHLNRCLADRAEFRVNTRIIVNGHADPLHGVTETPDLLLLHYTPGHGELQHLVQHRQDNRIPLVVCGPDNDPEGMRLAMQAHARDYLPATAPESELVASLMRVRDEASQTEISTTGQLVSVINSKGGSGASFIATNLAHGLVVDAKKHVTLVDLDFQLGGLCRYLDMSPKIGILQALEVAKQMDDVSADAYTKKHSSGLRLLAAPSAQPVRPEEIQTDQLDALLNVFLSNNDYVVTDVPNQLNSATEFVLGRADRIVLVVQQSLPNVQDASRLTQLLTGNLAISRNKIEVVVNRFSKNSLIELRDIRKMLRLENVITIPNQYKLAAESINSGIPVGDISKNAPLTRGIRSLQETFEESENKPAQNILARALPNILRS